MIVSDFLWSHAFLTKECRLNAGLLAVVVYPVDTFCWHLNWTFFCADEALQKQEKSWHQEVEELLSFCSALSNPSRPKHIDFLRITAPEDDLIDTPTSSPLPLVAQVSSVLF